MVSLCFSLAPDMSWLAFGFPQEINVHLAVKLAPIVTHANNSNTLVQVQTILFIAECWKNW